MTLKAILLVCGVSFVRADGGHGHGGGGVSSGYSAPSNQYEVPSAGYGAPSSGYGAPSSGYGAPSSGYGAPSSGYGAPSSGYGAPSSSYNGGSSGPVYFYQTTEASGGKGLASLLPLGALALAVPLGLLALTLPVTTTLIGRKKREVMTNSSLAEQQAELLHSYLNLHGLQHNFNLQREMIARYLECGDSPMVGNSGRVSSCLERLMCSFHDPEQSLRGRDREVAHIIIETILQNEFISKGYKNRLEAAGDVGRHYPGSCAKFSCSNAVFYQARPDSPK